MIIRLSDFIAILKRKKCKYAFILKEMKYNNLCTSMLNFFMMGYGLLLLREMLKTLFK